MDDDNKITDDTPQAPGARARLKAIAALPRTATRRLLGFDWRTAIAALPRTAKRWLLGFGLPLLFTSWPLASVSIGAGAAHGAGVVDEAIQVATLVLVIAGVLAACLAEGPDAPLEAVPANRYLHPYERYMVRFWALGASWVAAGVLLVAAAPRSFAVLAAVAVARLLLGLNAIELALVVGGAGAYAVRSGLPGAHTWAMVGAVAAAGLALRLARAVAEGTLRATRLVVAAGVTCAVLAAGGAMALCLSSSGLPGALVAPAGAIGAGVLLWRSDLRPTVAANWLVTSVLLALRLWV
jgi:hypothetical protein